MRRAGRWQHIGEKFKFLLFYFDLSSTSPLLIRNFVIVVNFPYQENLMFNTTVFPHHNIHKYTWTSSNGRTRNKIDHVLVDER